jgi:hypothetical protein
MKGETSTVEVPMRRAPKPGLFARVLSVGLSVSRGVEQEPFVRMKADVSIMVEAPNASSAFTALIIGDLMESDEFDKLEEDLRSALHSFVDPCGKGVPDGGDAVRVVLIKEGPTLVPKATTPVDPSQT